MKKLPSFNYLKHEFFVKHYIIRMLAYILVLGVIYQMAWTIQDQKVTIENLEYRLDKTNERIDVIQQKLTK